MALFGVPSKGERKARIRLDLPRDERLLALLKRHCGGDNKWNELVAKYGDPTLNDRLEIKNFVLESTQRSKRQRYQIVETNESPTLFAYGDLAKVYFITLRVINAGPNIFNPEQNNNWLDELEEFYDLFKLHILIDYNMTLKIITRDREITGYWLNFNISEQAEMDKVATITFDFYVTDERQLNISKVIEGAL